MPICIFLKWDISTSCFLGLGYIFQFILYSNKMIYISDILCRLITFNYIWQRCLMFLSIIKYCALCWHLQPTRNKFEIFKLSNPCILLSQDKTFILNGVKIWEILYIRTVVAYFSQGLIRLEYRKFSREIRIFNYYLFSWKSWSPDHPHSLIRVLTLRCCY